MGIQGQGIERIFTSNHRPACNKLHAQILSDQKGLALSRRLATHRERPKGLRSVFLKGPLSHEFSKMAAVADVKAEPQADLSQKSYKRQSKKPFK
jgi:hypothetical protein